MQAQALVSAIVYLLSFLLVVVQGQINVNTPSTFIFCQVNTLTWLGGTGPYTVNVQSSNRSYGNFADISTLSVQWKANPGLPIKGTQEFGQLRVHVTDLLGLSGVSDVFSMSPSVIPCAMDFGIPLATNDAGTSVSGLSSTETQSTATSTSTILSSSSTSLVTTSSPEDTAESSSLPSLPSPSPTQSDEPRITPNQKRLIIAGSIAAAIVALTIFGIIACCSRRRAAKRSQRDREALDRSPLDTSLAYPHSPPIGGSAVGRPAMTATTTVSSSSTLASSSRGVRSQFVTSPTGGELTFNGQSSSNSLVVAQQEILLEKHALTHSRSESPPNETSALRAQVAVLAQRLDSVLQSRGEPLYEESAPPAYHGNQYRIG